MANTKKRVLSLLMALVMTLGLFPVSAFAAGDETPSGVGSTWVDVESGNVIAEKEHINSNADFVTTEKTAKRTDNENEFEIQLKVTTKENLSQLQIAPDAAVVLVVDTSGSMTESAGKGITRMESVRKILAENTDSFLNKYADVQSAKDVRRMVAIVNFASTAKAKEIGGQYWADVANKTGLQSAKDVINGFTADGGTNIEGGLQLAYNLLTDGTLSKPVEKITNRYVILLTDGVPTYHVKGDLKTNVSEFTSYAGEGNKTSKADYERIPSIADGIKNPKLGNAKLQAVAYGNVSSETIYTAWQKKTCKEQGWHRHGSTERTKYAYGSGTEGKINDGAFEECKHTKNCNCEKGYFDGRHTGNTKVYLEVTVEDWLTDVVKINELFTPANADGLANAFATIVANIQKLAQAWIVTDPMGDYVEYVPNSASKDAPLVGFEDGTLTWHMMKDEPEDDGNGTYTYTLTYRVKLLNDKEGFIDVIKSADGTEDEKKLYPTNGQTTLQYVVKTNDGTGEALSELKPIDFYVPTVWGTIPEYTYTTEFYKQNDEDENYTKVDGDTERATAKLYSPVNATGYENKYDRYTFVDAPETVTSLTITANPEENVLRLYYAPAKAEVTVNHRYKTITIDENGVSDEATATYNLTETVTTKTVVGKSFEIATVPTAGGLDFSIDEVENGTSTIGESGGKYTLNTVQENPESNVVDVYYSRTDDKRLPASIQVTHSYTASEWTWDATQGKFVITDAPSVEVPVLVSHDQKINSSFSTSTEPYNQGETNYSGYTYLTGSATGTNTVTEDAVAKTATMPIKQAENFIKLKFSKAPTNEPAKATVQVFHHYSYDVTTMNGTLPETDKGTENNKTVLIEDAHAGDLVSAYFADETNDRKHDYLYVANDGNAAALKQALHDGTNEVHLYYTYRQAPDPTGVTVNHIYETKTEVTTTIYEEREIKNEAGEVTGTEQVATGTKTETVYDEKTRESATYPNETETTPLYVGQKYTAVLATPPEGYADYAYDKTRSTEDLTIAALDATAGSNVIDIHYVLDADDQDKTDKTTVSVVHHYVTHVTGVRDGEIDQWIEKIEMPQVDYADQTVGGSFTAEPVLTCATDSKEYALTERSASEEARTIDPLQKNNGTIVVNYERTEDCKGDMVPYEANYTYNAYTMTAEKNKDGNFVGVYGEPTVDKNTLTPQQTGENYVGMDITLTTDGKVDAYPEVVSNPGTAKRLSAAGNVYDFVYAQYTPLAQVKVQTNHHYTAIDENGNPGDPQDKIGAAVPAYLGTTFQTAADPVGEFQLQYYTLKGAETHYDGSTYKVEQLTGDVTVDFYYTAGKGADVTYSILHVYSSQDWNETEPTVTEVYTAENAQAVAGNMITGAPDLKPDSQGNNLYQLDNATASKGFIEGGYSMKLTATGENIITFYYSRSFDSRVASTVLVNHYYRVQDTYTGITTDEGTRNQQFTSYKDDGKLDFDATGIYVGAGYQATLVTENDGKTYAFADSNYPNYTITIAPVEMSGVEGEVPVQINNIINIYYLRTISSDPGTPPPTEPIIPPVEPDNDPDEGYGPGENPLENIVTPEVPLADLPETEIPLTELPETEVPLAEAPATGDNLAMWIMAAAISGLSLVWLMISGKKHKDENAE